MASQISVQSLPKSKASRHIPDKLMIRKQCPSREDFPDILFVYTRPYTRQPAGQKRYLYVNGMLVIDSKNRPVRAWPELNLTVSSNVEGFRLEALQRTNPHISATDILARMPLNVTRAKKGEVEVIPQQLKPNALSMRKRAFRGNNGMLSWTTREGTMEIKNYLDSLLGPELVAANSTRDMRPLSAKEIERIMFVLGKGKHPERSRHKSPTAVPARKRKTEQQKFPTGQQDEASDTEIPSDLEDHFEPMDLDDQRHGEPLDSDLLSSAEDPVEPSVMNEVQDQLPIDRDAAAYYGLDLDDIFDCRNHIPTTLDERQIVATATQASTNEYFVLLGTPLEVPADLNFWWESYNTQWLAVQEALETAWVRRGWNLDECPELSRYPRFEGLLLEWRYTGGV
ncbi:MAG: hypothetical protein LQ341_004805 [Variospora aurantia]|nr:MAG: hypothetical protein LQ341_004805 [Variospora aurantia]